MTRCSWRGSGGPPCNRPAIGAIGQLSLCRTCVAQLLARAINDPALDHVIAITLTDDGVPLAQQLPVEWRPFRRP